MQFGEVSESRPIRINNYFPMTFPENIYPIWVILSYAMDYEAVYVEILKSKIQMTNQIQSSKSKVGIVRCFWHLGFDIDLKFELWHSDLSNQIIEHLR